MSGPQFVHLQSFSRKPNPAGQSVDQIFGELVRDPEYSRHVEGPTPPELLDGITPQELVSRHEAMIDAAKVEVKVKGKVHHRAIRKDRHTLMTAIASYPVPWDQIEGDPEARVALRAWEARNVAFFKKLFGEQYQASFRHTDEAYPHIHVYALPELVPGVDAAHLHPGKREKARAIAKAETDGLSAREAVGSGNRALKATMRKFQDVYFLHVGEPSGLLRLGPRRQRMSRKAYIAQKHAASQRRVSVLEKRSAELRRREAAVASSLGAFREKQDHLDQLEADLERRLEDLVVRETKIKHVARRIALSVKQLHALIDGIGEILGLGRFTSIQMGLQRLGEAAVALHAEFRSPSEPTYEDEAGSPSL